MNENTSCGDVNCGFCDRNDVSVITDTTVRIVTYVGEYCVQTMEAPELMDPMIDVLQTFGVTKFPPYVTTVCYLGKELSLGSSVGVVPDSELVRFMERHNSKVLVKDAHDMVVSSVKDGTLDLSKPISMEELAESGTQYFEEALKRLGSDGLSGTAFDF